MPYTLLGPRRVARAHNAPVRSLLVVALLVACGASPQQNRRRAEYAIGGSLVGVMAGGLTMAAVPSEKPILIPVTIAFGALAVASTVVYVIVDGQDR